MRKRSVERSYKIQIFLVGENHIREEKSLGWAQLQIQIFRVGEKYVREEKSLGWAQLQIQIFLVGENYFREENSLGWVQPQIQIFRGRKLCQRRKIARLSAVNSDSPWSQYPTWDEMLFGREQLENRILRGNLHAKSTRFQSSLQNWWNFLLSQESTTGSVVKRKR